MESVSITFAYTQLRATASFFCDLTILSFDDTAQVQYDRLQSLKQRIGTLDKRIAAIVLSQDGILVTRNQGDFAQIPGLHFEDWSQ